MSNPFEFLPGTASLVEELDIVLRDGRKLIGILRSFDQFANIVLESTVERIYVDNNKYGEKSYGLYLVRGENVVLLGEVDEDKETQLSQRNTFTKIPYEEASKQHKKEQEEKEAQLKLKRKLLLERGVPIDPFVFSDALNFE